MCTQIKIIGGDGIDSCGQLWKLVGKGAVVWTEHSGDHEFQENECLCHCDVEATAKRNGYSCRPGWDEFGCDYIWERH